MTTSNGFTQKELNQMIFDKLDDIDKKLDEKLDKSEFYKVLGLVATVILIVGSLSMWGVWWQNIMAMAVVVVAAVALFKQCYLEYA